MRNSNAGRDHQFLSEASILYIIAGLLFFVFLISCNSPTTSEEKADLSDSTTTNPISNTPVISKKKTIF